MIVLYLNLRQHYYLRIPITVLNVDVDRLVLVGIEEETQTEYSEKRWHGINPLRRKIKHLILYFQLFLLISFPFCFVKWGVCSTFALAFLNIRISQWNY